MLEDYKNALKSGQRAYRACVARGQSPYLAVLDDILVNVNIVSQEPLGLVEIPAESIVGTKTSGRHTAFAPNFMPLLEADTEFAAKWSNLCEAHLEEGIHTPIIAFEFMNRFYVQEGNKRVSVLKYYGPADPGAQRQPGKPHLLRVPGLLPAVQSQRCALQQTGQLCQAADAGVQGVGRELDGR